MRSHTPLCKLSMVVVETKQRARAGDNPKWLTVNISARPSRRLAAHWDFLVPATRHAYPAVACPLWQANNYARAVPVGLENTTLLFSKMREMSVLSVS